MSSLTRMTKLILLRRTFTSPKCLSSIRAISTSNKKDDTTTVVGPTTTQPDSTTTCEPKKRKFFYDYGYGGVSEEDENNKMHLSFFMYVTMLFVGSGFYFLYRPKHNLHDWALREGYLELRRREQLGLPLIDPNYVDPSTIYLPSDEDLGDTEVII